MSRQRSNRPIWLRRAALATSATFVWSLGLAAPLQAHASAPGQNSRSKPTPTVSLYSEYNAVFGYFAPTGAMTFCAVVYAPGSNAALVGVPVVFSFTGVTGAAPSANPSSATTNGCGQALTVVTSGGAFSATLVATYTDPSDGVPYSATNAVSGLIDACLSGSGADPPLPWGRFTDNAYLSWASTSAYDAANSAGIGIWQESGWGAYTKVRVLSAWNILYQDLCNDMSAYFAVTTASGVDKRVVTWNPYMIDPCPTGTCPAGYPPASSRHHMATSAAHEIGHAMGLAHTYPSLPNDRGALMWPDNSNWFLCFTQQPQVDEDNGLTALGYTKLP